MLRYRPPSRDEASVLYLRFVRKTGLDPVIGETAIEFAHRARQTEILPDDVVTRITDAYVDTRYGPYREPAFERLKVAVGSIS